MNEPIQPEELTELLDDDLEMWAQGGTRILPKSQLEKPAGQPDSLPPVAYPSAPPPPVMPVAKTNAPVWAALIGMAAVFFLAAVGGGIFYAIHRSANDTTEAAASPSVVTTAAATTSEPEPVALTTATTAEPVEIVAPTAATTNATPASSTHKVSAIAAPPPPAVVRYGTIQTFAAGSGKPVFLDGKQIGTGGSHLKAACGKHAVSVGSGKAKTYDIPCSGNAVTVGTPDGT